VPEISRFFGIVVAMYYDDHPPPHFHVRYGEPRAILEWGHGQVMMKDIVEVRPLGGHRLYLRFYAELSGTAIAVPPAPPTRRTR